MTTIRLGEPTSIAHDSWMGYGNCMPFSILPPGKGEGWDGVECLRTMRRSTPTLALPQPGGGNKLVVARRFTTVLIEAAHAFRSYAEQRLGVPARRDPPIRHRQKCDAPASKQA